MKKTMKRMFSLIVLCFSLFCLLQIRNVEAALGDKAGEAKSDYAVAISDLQKTELVGGVKLYKQAIKSLYNGITDKTNKKYAWNNHTVQWVDLPASTENVSVVVWTKGTENGWASATVRTTAMDFEKKNPGWIVVAAVNGDFFDIEGTKEPTNISVQMGDVYQPIALNTIRKGIGFNSYDLNDRIIGDVSLDSKLSIEKIVDGKVESSIHVASVNTYLSETGITLITKDVKGSFDLTGYKVLVGQYDTCRVTKSDTSRVFVKGTLVSKEEINEAKKPSMGQFYLVSKDGSLDNFVSEGDYVRCQYNLTNEWANYDNVIGYTHQILNNSEPMYQGNTTDDFVYTTHPRTFVGFKEDGSVVMMVTEGRGKESDNQIGTSLFQGAELMRLAGCKTAYNLDGGGSSTLIVRNGAGTFETINRPSDGGERAIGNAVLFVMRDPGFKFNQKESTRTSVIIDKEQTLISEELKNVTVKIANKTYEFVGNRLEITGLEENTTYEVVIEYEEKSRKDPTKTLKGQTRFSVKTKAFICPPSGLEIVQVNKEGIVVEKIDNGYADWIQNVKVIVSGASYYMGSESRLEITELLSDTDYVVQFEYDVIEPGNPKKYPITESEQYIKTLAFNLPIFEKIEIVENTNTSAKISYEYDDQDDIMIGAYVVCYNDLGKEVAREKVSRKRGTVEFTGLDLTQTGYSFKVEAQYYATEGATFADACYSEAVSLEKVEIVEEPETPKKGCFKKSSELMIATISVASLAILILRKKK